VNGLILIKLVYPSATGYVGYNTDAILIDSNIYVTNRMDGSMREHRESNRPSSTCVRDIRAPASHCSHRVCVATAFQRHSHILLNVTRRNSLL